ncbi:MAG: hypothetical protein J5486_10745 [Bacteroidaceae bacterium]|nr:hypothetical protein [Bacteroidaceae bacterium]
MKALLFSLILLLTSASTPWKGRFISDSQPATLELDLYEESVDVPGMDIFGPMNGYLNGAGIYGTWMVTSFQVEDDSHATVRLSNDLGSETQEVELTLQGDTMLVFRQVKGAVIKRVEGKKLVKIPHVLEFRRQPVEQ